LYLIKLKGFCEPENPLRALGIYIAQRTWPTVWGAFFVDSWHTPCSFEYYKASQVQPAHTMGESKQYSMGEHSPAWASTNEFSYYVLMPAMFYVLDIVATMCYDCVVAGNGSGNSQPVL